MPRTINKPGYHPQLINPTTPPESLSVEAIQASRVKVYWGPSQLFNDPDYGPNIYTPPSDWPRANLLFRMVHVCRIIYESCDYDVECFFAQGPAGSYTYGIHTDSYSFYDISSNPAVIFSSIVDVTHPFPFSTPGVPCYATQFHSVSSGYSGGDVTLTVSGGSTGSYQALLSPVFSYTQYYEPNSALAGAVQIAVDILGVQAVGSPPAVYQPDAAPPYTTTFDGPNGNGLVIIKTGNFTIDSYEYNDGTDLSWPATPIIIPQGYKQPIPAKDTTLRDQALQDGFDQLQYNLKEANRDTYPYLGISNLYNPTSGINSAPTSQFFVPPDETNWFGTNCINVLVVVKPHLNIPDIDIQAIKDTYTGSSMYRLIVYIDDAYPILCSIPPSVVALMVSQWTDFCSQLSSYGVILGGLTSTNSFYFGGQDIPSDIQNAIFTLFPTTGPDAPKSYDPPRTEDPINQNGFLYQKQLQQLDPVPDITAYPA
jgi:hypothetical protein